MKQILKTLAILFCFFSFAQHSNQNKTQDQDKNQFNNQKWDLLFEKINHHLYQKKNNDSVAKYLALLTLKNIKGTDSLFYAKKMKLSSVLNYRTSKYELSIADAKTAITLFEKYGEYYQAALAKRDLGSTYQLLFNNKEALFYFNQAEKLLGGEDKILMHIGMGAVHAQLNNLDESINHYNKAIKLSETLETNKYLYNIYNGMGGVYTKNNDFPKVYKMLNNALNIAIKNKNYLGQTVVLHNLGYQNLKQLRYQDAENYLKQAILLFDKIDNDFIKGSTYTNYADVLLNLNRIKKATAELNKAATIFSKLKNTGRLSRIAYVRAEIESKKGNYQKAIILLENTLNSNADYEISGIRANNYLALAKAYKNTNNASKSFKAFENYVNIQDSIINRKKIKEIETVKARFEIDEMEQNLKLQEQDLALLSAKNKSSNYRNLLLGLLLLTSILFIYRQRKLNQSRREVSTQERKNSILKESFLKDKMKFKNAIITEYAIHINQHNTFLDACKLQINGIKNLTNESETKSKLTNLLYYIKDSIDMNKEHINFNKEIKKTEESFRFNLTQKHPNLTEKEVIVCSLLLLNMPSKKIASKMNISFQTVNNYRTTIRKKLKLTARDNLKHYLKHL